VVYSDCDYVCYCDIFGSQLMLVVVAVVVVVVVVVVVSSKVPTYLSGL